MAVSGQEDDISQRTSCLPALIFFSLLILRVLRVLLCSYNVTFKCGPSEVLYSEYLGHCEFLHYSVIVPCTEKLVCLKPRVDFCLWT